jgi:hypothetical protein
MPLSDFVLSSGNELSYGNFDNKVKVVVSCETNVDVFSFLIILQCIFI